MTETRDSSEYGWQSISRTLYEQMRQHEYAGPGTPLHPEQPGYWVMAMDHTGATCLYTGVSIEES